MNKSVFNYLPPVDHYCGHCGKPCTVVRESRYEADEVWGAAHGTEVTNQHSLCCKARVYVDEALTEENDDFMYDGGDDRDEYDPDR